MATLNEVFNEAVTNSDLRNRTAAAIAVAAWTVFEEATPSQARIEGGIASCLIAFLELIRRAGETTTTLGEVSGHLGLIIGTATFSGSMIAAGKLAGLVEQKPVVFPFHSLLLAGTALAGESSDGRTDELK